MRRRTNSQATGALGQRLVETWLEKSGFWIARNQGEDFGVDLEAELASPHPAGMLLKLQIKSTTAPVLSDDQVQVRIDASLLRYAAALRIPFVLVQVDVKRERAWYCWLQRQVLRLRLAGGALGDLGTTTRVYIPHSQELTNGLRNELQDIAAWRTSDQQIIALTDLLRSSGGSLDLDDLDQLLKLAARLSQDDGSLNRPGSIGDCFS